MQKEFPGKKVEEYRRMLGQFGVTGSIDLFSTSALHSLCQVTWLYSKWIVYQEARRVEWPLQSFVDTIQTS